MNEEGDTLPPPLDEPGADDLPTLPFVRKGPAEGLGLGTRLGSAGASPAHFAARRRSAPTPTAPSVEPAATSLPSSSGTLAETRPAAEVAPLCTSPGWFGKLASLGDFASRRLPEAFVAQCDSWLSRGVARSRQQLGESWLDIYLTAPLWRFALAPGVAGECWWLGALMPSVDRVGRYFPLLLCEAFSGPPSNRAELDLAERWFDHLAQAALSTLQPNVTLESFETSLQAAPRWQGAGTVALPQASRSPGHDRYLAAAALPLAGWIAGIGAAQLQESLHGRSLWWAPPAAPDAAASFNIADGWPPPERFADLLEGCW